MRSWIARRTLRTMSMSISGEKIAAIYIVRNPDKLRHLQPRVAHRKVERLR